MKTQWFKVLLAVAFCMTAASCNTIRGFGKDLQKGGEVIEDAAEDTGGTD